MSYVKQVRRRIATRRRAKAFYAITTFLIEDDKIVRQRTIGWFWTEAEAKDCVLQNGGDWIETGWYKHALVERYDRHGLYQWPRKEERWWYRAKMPKGCRYANEYVVVKCKQPKVFDGSGGFGAFG